MDLEHFPTSESAKRMLGSVSLGFYDHSYVGKWLFEVMGLEMDDARERFEELPLQAFPETATWGLRYHEEKYGLPIRSDLTDEQRRKEIYQRRDSKTAMTPYAMERLLRNVTDFKVCVADSNDLSAYIPKISHPNVFEVVLIGQGTAAIAKIRTLLDRVKQSHTLYNLMYYEYSEYQVNISYDNTVRFRTVFHPRYNLPYLHLDNLWTLGGSRRLNGYDSADTLDFYPVRLRIPSGAKEDIRSAQQLRIENGVNAEIQEEAALRMQTKAAEDIEMAEQVQIRAGAEYNAEYACYMTKLNKMDGTWKLDGSRKLDGGRYIL